MKSLWGKEINVYLFEWKNVSRVEISDFKLTQQLQMLAK